MYSQPKGNMTFLLRATVTDKQSLPNNALKARPTSFPVLNPPTRMDIRYWTSLLSCGKHRKTPPQTSTVAAAAPFQDFFGLFNRDDSLKERGTLIFTTDYASRCRDIMELYKNLCYLGVHHDASFEVPRVVVIGSQSSGKSSLIEAVSGINVPRDSGTCTRCPMECTMSSDAKKWSCSIEIRREYDDNDIRLPSFAVDHFGPPIEKKSEVELWIRRAQAAILSPYKSYSEFYNMSEDELKTVPGQRKFSRNIVHITVNDPEATDLSFVDLPGLISNDEDHLIDTVKCMVEQYIHERNTLIVIAMPMTDDYQNMQAVRLAKEVGADPDGKRTIGVLTKPDMLEPGAIGALSSWDAVLKGAKYETKHGYYCVRLPNDVDRARGLSKIEAQHEEETFFNSTPPWDQWEDRTRFGVPNFVKNISKLLIGLIDECVPDLRRKIRSELSSCEFELAGLPPVSTENAPTEIMVRINDFCAAVKEAVFGEKDESFVRANRELYSKFKQNILETMPDFRPFEGDNLSEYTTYVPCSQTKPRGLEYIREIIQRCRGWELPRQAPYKYKASQTLIKEYTGLWADPAQRCFDDVVKVQEALLRKLIRGYFSPYANLEAYVSEVIFKARTQCIIGAKEMLDKILQMEYDPFFTQNMDELANQENKWYSRYLQDMNRKLESDGSQVSSGVSSPLASSPTVGHDASSKEVPWRTEDEVKIMANVQAYFQVTHHRIIDNVPLIIEHELNQNFSGRIQKVLVGAMLKDFEAGQVVHDDLLREDSNTATRRRYLEDRISQLQRVGAQLDQFTHKSSGPVGHD